MLFDRGISKGETLTDWSREGKSFMTRMKCNRKYKLIKINEIVKNEKNQLSISSDEIIHLYIKKKKEIKEDLRLIKAENSKKKEVMVFDEYISFILT